MFRPPLRTELEGLVGDTIISCHLEEPISTPRHQTPSSSTPRGNIPQYHVLPRTISHQCELPCNISTISNHHVSTIPSRTIPYHFAPFATFDTIHVHTIKHHSASNTTILSVPQSNASLRVIQLYSATPCSIKHYSARISTIQHHYEPSRTFPCNTPLFRTILKPLRIMLHNLEPSRTIQIYICSYIYLITHSSIQESRNLLPTNKKRRSTYQTNNQPTHPLTLISTFDSSNNLARLACNFRACDPTDL